MDIRQCFPSIQKDIAHRRRRLQYGNSRWTPDQEADYLRWRSSIPYTNADIADGYRSLAKTASPNLARAYLTSATQIRQGKRISRHDYKTVLFALASHARLIPPSGDVKPSDKDSKDYLKVTGRKPNPL